MFATRFLSPRWAALALLSWLAAPPACSATGANGPAGPDAANWPMYRGNPALTGAAAGKLADKLSLLWTFKTGGPVKGSAAVWNGRVFIGSGDSNVFALELSSGRKIWEHKTGGEIESSPLVLDGRVFIGSSDGALYALEAGSGRLAWRFETGDKILGAPNWVRPPKGEAAWILVGSYDFKLYCLDAASGQTNWVHETGNYINGSPAVAEGKTGFGGCDGLLHILSLADGRKLKEVEIGAPIAGSAAVVGNLAYFGHYENEFLCVDLVKGEIVWRYKDRSFPYFSSPAIAGDRVVFGGRDKRLHCAQRDDGAPLWTFATRGKVDSSPVVCDGKVVVGSDDGRLYLLSLADGKELWSYEIGQPITGSPAVVNGLVIIGSDDGNVYGFGSR